MLHCVCGVVVVCGDVVAMRGVGFEVCGICATVVVGVVVVV